jgi:hypothetical protein
MFLFLSIYNENEYYDEMMIQMNTYIKSINRDDFCYFFILFKKIDSEYYIDYNNNILIINGEESYIPGILNKTIKAIDILTNKLKIEYKFLIRTTVATSINIPKMINLLNILDENKSYYIGNLQTLQWIDHYNGIVDETHWGTFFSGGAFSIFSKNIALDMIKNKEKFVYNIADDVSIGKFINNLEGIDYLDWGELAEYHGRWNECKVIYFNNTNKNDRTIDINNQKIINENLLKNEN